MIFNGRFGGGVRVVAAVTAAAMLWLSGPATAFAKGRPRAVAKSRLRAGLTDRVTPDVQTKIDALQAAKAKKAAAIPDVRVLMAEEMREMSGRGPMRNASFSGTLPWQRSLRDVNLCNGNLFKSFTDIQVAPARGAGLALQRTYNSDDDRIGPFGVGWTHAYDIRVEEAGVDPATQVEKVKRTDFFGAKHSYARDADGLYTPPPYMFDELSSNYDTFLSSGPSAPLDDSQKGMDGTVKHFTDGGTNADGSVNHNLRLCDYIQDRHGNTTSLTYGLTATMADGSTQKLLTQVTDPTGRSLVFTWTDLGTTGAPAYRITQVEGPVDSISGSPVSGVSYRVVYGYGSDATNADSYQNLTSVTLDPDGLNRTTTFTYTDCSGTVYDPVSGAPSGDTENGLLASVSDPLGHTVTYAYQQQRNVLGTVFVCAIGEPGGIDPTSGAARVHHWTITDDPDPNPGLFNVNDDDHPASTGDGWFGVYTDSQLRFVCYTSTVWTSHYNAYDSANNVVQTQDEFQAWKHTYDITRWTTSTYGPHGNVLTQTVPGFSGTTATTYYDASKYFQKASVTDMNGRTSSFDYYADDDVSAGNRGEVKWVQDANYGTTGAQFTYTYNSFGQKTSETNLNGVVTRYTYGDTLGDLTQVVQDPSTTTPAYTGLNRTTSMSYDYASHVLSSTDPNGHTSSFYYNTLGQPTSAGFPAVTGSSAETIGYSYDANGRTSAVTDNRGTTSMSYESGCDRVSSVTDPVTGTMGYTYMLSGERNSATLPSGETMTYQYAAPQEGGKEVLIPKDDPNSVMRRLTAIVDGEGRRVDIDTLFLGGLRSVKYDQSFNSGGTLLQYVQQTPVYDGLAWPTVSIPYSHGWLTQQSVVWNVAAVGSTPASSQVLNQNNYSYDPVGQRTGNTISSTSGGVTSSRTESYGYDALNRLTSVNYGDGQTQGYSFDAMGNRSAKSDSSTGGESYGYDAANRLTSRTVGSTTSTVTSDANGNTLTDGERSNTWDSQNRLITCASSAGGSATTSTFTYGSDGLRRRGTITESDGTKTRTDYIYDSSMLVEQVIQHFSSSGAALDSPTTITYMQGPSGPMYRKSSAVADPSWYVYDGLGSVVGEVDVSGNLTASKLFDVYGLTRSYSGTPTTRQGFVGGLGHESDDETGLIYMRARYYDPSVGRFISQDPKASGANWFQYCNCSPTNSVDSSGYSPIAVIGSMAWWDEIFAYATSAASDAEAAKMLGIIAKTLMTDGAKSVVGGELIEALGEKISLEDEAEGGAIQAFGGKTIGRGLSDMFASEQLDDVAEMIEGINAPDGGDMTWIQT